MCVSFQCIQSFFCIVLAICESRQLNPAYTRYGRQPSHLTDIVRCRILCEDIEHVLKVVKKIQSRAWEPESQNSDASGACECRSYGSNVPERIFKICNIKNRFDPYYRPVQTFGFRDLQLNLEVGFVEAPALKGRDQPGRPRKEIVPCCDTWKCGRQRELDDIFASCRS